MVGSKIMLYVFLFFSLCLLLGEGDNISRENYFKEFIHNYFSKIISPECLVQSIKNIHALNEKYKERLSADFNNWDFSDKEYSCFKAIMNSYFQDKSCIKENKELPLKQLKTFKDLYQRAYGSLFKADYQNLPLVDGPEGLIFYFFDSSEESVKSHPESFFSDIHSSPIYCSWILEGINRDSKKFNPFIFGGDLSDRSLLPHANKNKLAVVFDLYLNQIHLLINLYNHYCLKENKKENIFLLSTLGNHEEEKINLYQDKKIYFPFWNKSLEEYSQWSLSMFKQLIPLEAKFLNVQEKSTTLSSFSHAIGKQLYIMKKVYGGKDFIVMKALPRLNLKNSYFDKDCETYLNLVKDYADADLKPALWTDPFCSDGLSSIYYQSGRGFQVGEITKAINIFKKIEIENMVQNKILDRGIEKRMLSNVTYYTCCGHQHNEKTIRDGFTVDFQKGKIFFSSYYEDVGSNDRLYFSMCAYCMNLYYLQLNKYLEILNREYPELLCFLEIDFVVNAGYKNRDQLKKSNFILNGNTFINHEEILTFLENKKDQNDIRLKKAKMLFNKKNPSLLSDNNKILHEKMKDFFDKI